MRIESDVVTGATLSVLSARILSVVGSVDRGSEGYDRAVRELEIDGRRIADDTDCFVIAEIGHNHQGSVEKARELFALAKQSGVDAVKLQKRDNRRLFTRALYESPYDNENSFGPTYGAHREALELDREAYAELRGYARELGLVFFATAFDEPSADLLEELDVAAYKIASGDLRNTPLLRHVAAFGKPLLVSTGGATLEDVDRAVDAVTAVNPQLCLLQCTASYPAAVEELELGVIATYRERYPELVVGLSDHQDGIAMAPVAYMLGARVIEKHFTSSHTAKGTDHAFSLMPEGMRKLVRDLKRVPHAIGDGVKRPLPSETKPLEKMGKKLVASRDLPEGHVLVEGDLVAKSPGDGGVPPYRLDELLGRALVRSLGEDEAVHATDLADVAAHAVAETSSAAT
jgi:sialic acid synthase